jgi:hypothetical protein
MKRERAKDLLPIITAYAEGKVIECRDAVRAKQGSWEIVDEPSWVDTIEYRIKPKPRYIPFTFDDNLVGRVVVTRGGGKALIVGQIEGGVYVGAGLEPITYMALLLWTFLDGSPCGKLSEPKISD